MKSMRTIRYFAYGSNLWSEQMTKRCPDNSYVAIGCLPDYRLIFDGHDVGRAGAIANVVPDKGQAVWGALYDLTLEDLRRLDGFEDYPLITSAKL